MTTKNSDLVANLEALPQVANPANELGGVVRIAQGNVALAAGDSTDDDIVMLAPIPTNATLVSVRIGSDNLGGSCTYNVGFYTNAGVVVDEDALAEALENGSIAGAGLDVFGGHHEPPPQGAKILKMPNVVLTPHIGGATAEDIYRNFFVTSLDNIIRVIRGEEPLYVVS